MKKLKLKLLSNLACLAMTVAIVTASWPCTFIMHQPKEPEEVKKLRRF